MKQHAISVNSIYRYPVKGLSPEQLGSVVLRKGETLPADRRYAIENGPIGFDPADPKYFPKNRFLMLMRNERLATLRTRYLDDETVLVIAESGAEKVRADLSTSEGRALVRAFFEGFMPKELRGAPEMLSAPDGFRFTDSRSGYVSLLNRASIAELEGHVGAPVDPLRFRGNVLIDGLPAWEEFGWIDRRIRIGRDAVLEVTKRIVRCAATEVDPTTGLRDMRIVRTLARAFDHSDCGVYARVIEDGLIRPGDAIELLPAA